MIELGLSRISRLLRNIPINWKACHVAGTNGKGSVCSYASAILHASGLKCGRFTSPHLIHRWDCITIGEQPVPASLFSRIEERVKRDDHLHAIGASEFEILTATAFAIFNEAQIDVGVIEVGLGGSQDATNVLQSPTVTVLTKIGYDHQAFLGNTIEEITCHKAGIMKEGAPCLIDGTNDSLVCNHLEILSRQHRASSVRFIPQHASKLSRDLSKGLEHLKLAPHQMINAQLGLEASLTILHDTGRVMSHQNFMSAIEETRWPGRLQFLKLKEDPITQRQVLLDGAHNPQAARLLGHFVDERLRGSGSPVVWVVAISQGRDPRDILRQLLRPGDSIVATKFGPVQGMPWVSALEPGEIVDAALSFCDLEKTIATGDGATTSMREAFQISDGGPLVVAGSLYLISDILRFEEPGS